MQYHYEDYEEKSPLAIYCNIDFDVRYIFTPAEPMVRYYSDGSGDPGCPAEIELTSISVLEVKGENGIVELELHQKELLEKWLLDKFNDIPENLYTEILEYESDRHCQYDD